jgi:tRNA threonylcarbamoyladenosine biosynthesis protein TsaE
MIINVNNEDEMKAFGGTLGSVLSGGEVIELVGDVGAGKTTLTKGIAAGLAVDDDVQSPSFTISRVYQARDGLTLAHYDFYRLGDAGIMADDLSETANDKTTVTVIEWGGVVEGVLPADRLTITIEALSESGRRLSLQAGGPSSEIVEAKL